MRHTGSSGTLDLAVSNGDVGLGSAEQRRRRGSLSTLYSPIAAEASPLCNQMAGRAVATAGHHCDTLSSNQTHQTQRAWYRRSAVYIVPISSRCCSWRTPLDARPGSESSSADSQAARAMAGAGTSEQIAALLGDERQGELWSHVVAMPAQQAQHAGADPVLPRRRHRHPAAQRRAASRRLPAAGAQGRPAV